MPRRAPLMMRPHVGREEADRLSRHNYYYIVVAAAAVMPEGPAHFLIVLR